MTTSKDSEVLSMLQPDLLTVDDLIEKIKSRCCRVQNLASMSKERLVSLFRQLILPLPQRLYPNNRRGKMLTCRRTKSGLEGGRKRGKEEEGGTGSKKTSRVSLSDDRLRASSDLHKSDKIRICSDRRSSRSDNLDRIVINDRRKEKPVDRDDGSRRREEDRKTESSSSKKITLKRPSSSSETQSSSPSSPTESKKQRTAIRWP